MATDPPSTAGGYDEPAVMAVVGIEIVREGEGDGCCALQCPRCYSAAGTVHEMASARQESGG